MRSTNFHLQNKYQLQVLRVCKVSFTYPVHTTFIEVVSIINIKFKGGKVFIGHMPIRNQRIHKSRHNFFVLTVALILCMFGIVEHGTFKKLFLFENSLKYFFSIFFYFSHQKH